MKQFLMQLLGFKRPIRKKTRLPEGLEHLTVTPAKGWWN